MLWTSFLVDISKNSIKEKIAKLNSPIPIKEFKFVAENLPTKKMLLHVHSTKHPKNNLNSTNLFQNIEE